MFWNVFPVSFRVFSPFLGELILPGVCNILDLGSLICVLFAAFWNADLSCAWSLQIFGAWIIQPNGMCNILELGSLMRMLFATCLFTVGLYKGFGVGFKMCF